MIDLPPSAEHKLAVLTDLYRKAEARIRELEAELARYRQRDADRFIARHSLDDNPEAEAMDEELRNQCTPEERAVLDAMATVPLPLLEGLSTWPRVSAPFLAELARRTAATTLVSDGDSLFTGGKGGG